MQTMYLYSKCTQERYPVPLKSAISQVGGNVSVVKKAHIHLLKYALLMWFYNIEYVNALFLFNNCIFFLNKEDVANV